jgi:hypothetical protein
LFNAKMIRDQTLDQYKYHHPEAEPLSLAEFLQVASVLGRSLPAHEDAEITGGTLPGGSEHEARRCTAKCCVSLRLYGSRDGVFVLVAPNNHSFNPIPRRFIDGMG